MVCASLHDLSSPSHTSLRTRLTSNSNGWIASHVHILTHRCHLPPPALFDELPRTSFRGLTLSHDPRTLKLLERACSNLTNLHTLRVIFGHWNITRGLLKGLLTTFRICDKPLRRIWLENCSLAGIPVNLIRDANLQGIESIRLRRMHLISGVGNVRKQQVYFRGPTSEARQDGQGGLYATTTTPKALQDAMLTNIFETSNEHAQTLEKLHPLPIEGLPIRRAESPYGEAMAHWEAMFEEASTFDDSIFEGLRSSLPRDMTFCNGDELAHRVRAAYHVPSSGDAAEQGLLFSAAEPSTTAMALFRGSSKSLKSLNLDWLLIRRTDNRFLQISLAGLRSAMNQLFLLRFPQLRAFQLRNAVVAECELPPDLYLLESYDNAPQSPTNNFRRKYFAQLCPGFR